MVERATRIAVARAVCLAIGIPVFLILFVVMRYVGLAPFGNSYEPPETCIIYGGLPTGLAPDQVQETTTSWPLGLVCASGDLTVVHQNWAATIVSYSSEVAVLVCIVLLVVALLRWRFTSPRLPAMRHAVAQEFTATARSVPVLVGLVVVLAVLAVAVMLALIGT